MYNLSTNGIKFGYMHNCVLMQTVLVTVQTLQESKQIWGMQLVYQNYWAMKFTGIHTKMSLRIHKSGHNFLVLLYFYQLVFSDCVIDNVSENNSDCNQLWHFFRNEGCYCGISDHGVVSCDQQFIYCKQGTCVTWSNITSGAEVHHCLFTKWNDDMCSLHDVYRIPTTATGETLNHLTCGDYNRQGSYCSQCIDGYGPAVFSDDATCADCSKHRHLWILNLVFQLCMVTILCLVLHDAVSNQRNF